MNRFEKIYTDTEIIKLYNDIEKYENETGGWTYHNFIYVSNVTKMVENILRALGYDEEFIESTKIATIPQDTGALTVKKEHAYHGATFVKEYLKKKNLNLKYEEKIIEA